MIQVFYTSTFVRHLKKLPPSLQEEVKEKIELFKKNPRHPSLKLHKLHGSMKGYFSFSVNYSYRIIAEKDDIGVFALLGVGDHDVYK